MRGTQIGRRYVLYSQSLPSSPTMMKGASRRGNRGQSIAGPQTHTLSCKLNLPFVLTACELEESPAVEWKRGGGGSGGRSYPQLVVTGSHVLVRCQNLTETAESNSQPKFKQTRPRGTFIRHFGCSPPFIGDHGILRTCARIYIFVASY